MTSLDPAPAYATQSGPLTAWLFCRALGAIYVIAFLSLLVQIGGLIGDQGILPAGEFLTAVRQVYGADAYRLLPTVAWFANSTRALQVWCGAGVVCGLLLLAGRATRPALIGAFILYLSMLAVGQVFLSFQWDSLLLEAGALAFVATFWPAAGAWLFRWLIFRLLFLSGAVKIVSGDPNWRDLTALTYHFQTQPLPNVVSWYVQQAPHAVLVAGSVVTFLAELAVPLLFFAGRRVRLAGAIATVTFQAMIFLTGNYTFFNLLTVALALWLLDDARISGWLPRRFLPIVAPRDSVPRGWRRYVLIGVMAILLTSSTTQAWQALGGRTPPQLDALLGAIEPLRLTSSYGLFAVMTTTRPEIIFEGSDDGRTWQPYEFKYKAGDLRRAPAFVAPYQPRLDWQLWFAALGDPRTDRWVLAFAARLLQAQPAVLDLLRASPFGARAPRYVRATLYDYHFTTRVERAATGCWWARRQIGEYLPPLTLDGSTLRPATLP